MFDLKIKNYFDKLEDKIRSRLSHRPIIYSLIGGVSIVLFWRGVWNFADMFWFMNGPFWLPVSLMAASVVMLLTGLFTSFFVGDIIIISGLKNEKKLIEKTENEIKIENMDLSELKKELDEIKLIISELKSDISSIKPATKRKRKADLTLLE